MDVAGWKYDPLNEFADKCQLGGDNAAYSNITLNGEPYQFETNTDKKFMEIASDCEYSIALTWEGATVLGHIELTSETDVFSWDVSLPVIDATANIFNLHIGAEALEYFTVDGYSIR